MVRFLLTIIAFNQLIMTQLQYKSCFINNTCMFMTELAVHNTENIVAFLKHV